MVSNGGTSLQLLALFLFLMGQNDRLNQYLFLKIKIKSEYNVNHQYNNFFFPSKIYQYNNIFLKNQYNNLTFISCKKKYSITFRMTFSYIQNIT